jgi:hypothetical protein
LVAFAAAAALASSIQAASLPRVYIGYPNPAPCDQPIKVDGRYVDHHVACYQVRPSTISFSEDGNGDLSGIIWSAWKGTVNGHWFLPIRGHLFSPLVAMFSPRWWPRISPPFD